jgi:hypothetical protein
MQRGFYGMLQCFELIHHEFFLASGCGSLTGLVEHASEAGGYASHCICRKGIIPANTPKLSKVKFVAHGLKTIRLSGALVVIRRWRIVLITGCRAAYQLS